MKNIAFIYSGDEEVLASLENDRNELAGILEQHGEWDNIINKELNSLKEFQSDLAEFQNETIENVFFYFSGHGHRVGMEEKALYLEVKGEAPRDMNEFTRVIFDTFSDKLERLAVVLDTCYSGTYVNNNDIVSGSFEILTSSDNRQKSSANSISGMSRFTHYFCKSLEKLHQKSKPITLENIHLEMKKDLAPQKSLLAMPVLFYGRIPIIKNSTHSLESEIHNGLQQYFLEENLNLNELEDYTRRILKHSFNSVRIPSDFDALFQYLFRENAKVLAIILEQLCDNRLDALNEKLLQHLRISKSELKSLPYAQHDIKHQRSNLLITFKPTEKRSAMVQIFEFQDEKVEPKGNAFQIEFISVKSQANFVDTLNKHIKLSRKNVLLELFLPFEFLHEDIASWKSSDGELLEPKIIKRLMMRQEIIRNRPARKEEWDEVWEAYTNHYESELCNVMAEEIDNEAFEDTPYVRLKGMLCEQTHDLLLKEGGCIVLAPLKQESIKDLNKVCIKLQNTNFRYLLKKGLRTFKTNEVSPLFIWDNPNRLPLRQSEIEAKNENYVLGA